MTLTMNVLILKCIENQYQISFLPCSINLIHQLDRNKYEL